MSNRCKNMIKTLQIVEIIDTLDFVTDLDRTCPVSVILDEICFEPIDGNSSEEPKLAHRLLRDMTNPMEMFTSHEFKLRYSLSKETVIVILESILQNLERPSNRGKPVAPLIELLITIRFMTTGTFQSMIDDLHGISQPTISRMIVKVSTLLANLRHKYIQYPTQQELIELKRKFYDNTKFPSALGSIGTTHVGIKNPGGQMAESYLNEKGYYSLKIQIVCGPSLEFYNVVSQWPGGTHESKIFNISEVKHHLTSSHIKGYLLASPSYPVLTHILTPLKCPITSAEMKYNKAFDKAYNFPQAIELWKRRFKCLTTVLANKEKTSRAIIHAAAVLHNITLKHNDDLTEINLLLPVVEPRGKDIKRKFPLDGTLEPDPIAVNARKKFIKDNFN